MRLIAICRHSNGRGMSNVRAFLRTLCWWVLAVGPLVCHGVTQPHIVFILADDLGWNDVGFHGSKQIPTPNLDALASDGVVLHRYYTHSMCTPSRSAFLTGLYSSHTGMQHYVIANDQPWGLPLQLTILPQHLKKLGYATHIVGKWHQGFFRKEYTPTFRGFDSHFGFWGGAVDYYNHMDNTKKTKTLGLDIRRGMDVVYGTQGTYLTELLTSEAVQIISAHNKSQPMFLYFSSPAPHHGSSYAPLRSPLESLDRFTHIKDIKRRFFASVMSCLDKAVGLVFEALHDRDMLDNTLLVFASDNGGGFPGSWIGSGSNWPLRGMKQTQWEGGIRVPALVWSPLIQKRGNVLTEAVHVVDWLPTLYHLAGGNVSDLGRLDGLDVSEALVHGLPSRRSEMLHKIDPIENSGAVTVGDYKIIYGRQFDGKWDGWHGPVGEGDEASELPEDETPVTQVLKRMNRFAPIVDDWRSSQIVHCADANDDETVTCVPQENPCIFNIKEDPCERRNLAGSRPDILHSMMKKLDEFNATTMYPRNAPKDSLADPKYYNYVWTNWKDMEETLTCQNGCPSVS